MGRRADDGDSVGAPARAGVQCAMTVSSNPYSRADWTELQQRFHPPQDGPQSAPGCATMLRRRRSALSSLRYSFSGASLAAVAKPISVLPDWATAAVGLLPRKGRY